MSFVIVNKPTLCIFKGGRIIKNQNLLAACRQIPRTVWFLKFVLIVFKLLHFKKHTFYIVLLINGGNGFFQQTIN